MELFCIPQLPDYIMDYAIFPLLIEIESLASLMLIFQSNQIREPIP